MQIQGRARREYASVEGFDIFFITTVVGIYNNLFFIFSHSISTKDSIVGYLLLFLQRFSICYLSLISEGT